MIHFMHEGGYKKIGLNFYFTKGGFVVSWAWYDIRHREIYGWRFRFRAHLRPWFLFSRSRESIIDNYLFENDCVVVQKAVLEDYAPAVLSVAQFQRDQAAKDRLNRLMSV